MLHISETSAVYQEWRVIEEELSSAIDATQGCSFRHTCCAIAETADSNDLYKRCSAKSFPSGYSLNIG